VQSDGRPKEEIFENDPTPIQSGEIPSFAYLIHGIELLENIYN